MQQLVWLLEVAAISFVAGISMGRYTRPSPPISILGFLGIVGFVMLLLPHPNVVAGTIVESLFLHLVGMGFLYMIAVFLGRETRRVAIEKG